MVMYPLFPMGKPKSRDLIFGSERHWGDQQLFVESRASWSWGIDSKMWWESKAPFMIGWVVVSKIFHFHFYLGKWSNFTLIFQMGWFNHQLFLGLGSNRPFCTDPKKKNMTDGTTGLFLFFTDPWLVDTWKIIPFSKWLVIMVIVVGPLPYMAMNMAYKWGWS